MIQLFKTTVFAIFMLCSLNVIAQQKPKIHILATGGTIAGSGNSSTSSSYNAGSVAINELIDAVPQIKDIADIYGEQIVKIGSQDMSDEIWLTLAKRINILLQRDDVDAVIVTHGTDTMEETAFFLNLVIKSDKPVILVGAMLPSTAMSADGPMNLYNAVVTAASSESRKRGVLVVMNYEIFDARGVSKTNTTSVNTFDSPNGGHLGTVRDSKVYYNYLTQKPHTFNSEFDVTNINKLPQVAIIYSYSNIEPEMVEAVIKSDYDGIIHAGVGNGNIHKNIFPYLVEAANKNIVVVRSSRVPSGPTTLNGEINDKEYKFVASGDLNPQKARVLLQLALTKTKDWNKIQDLFLKY